MTTEDMFHCITLATCLFAIIVASHLHVSLTSIHRSGSLQHQASKVMPWMLAFLALNLWSKHVCHKFILEAVRHVSGPLFFSVSWMEPSVRRISTSVSSMCSVVTMKAVQWCSESTTDMAHKGVNVCFRLSLSSLRASHLVSVIS